MPEDQNHRKLGPNDLRFYIGRTQDGSDDFTIAFETHSIAAKIEVPSAMMEKIFNAMLKARPKWLADSKR